MKIFTPQQLESLAEKFAGSIPGKVGEWSWSIGIPTTGVGPALRIEFRHAGGFEHRCFPLAAIDPARA